MKKIAALMLGLMLCGCTAFANGAADPLEAIIPPSDPKDNVQVNQLFDYVYDPGVYTSLDFELGKDVVGKIFGGKAGMCTAVAKTLSNGDTVVGRNMDFNITRKPAYIIRTKGIEGQYDTVGVSYAQHCFPKNDSVKANGLSKWHRDVLPFSSTDVLNEKGLYCETNMRYDETDKKGNPVFASTGTNPKSKENIKVSYFQSNFPDTCQYDPRTELVADNTKWTTAYILDPKNQEEVQAKLHAGAAKLSKMTREEIMDNGTYWESTFTHLVNCNKKTMTVRFFEDDNKVMTLGFDK